MLPNSTCEPSRSVLWISSLIFKRVGLCLYITDPTHLTHFLQGWGIYLDCSLECLIPSKSTAICSSFTARGLKGYNTGLYWKRMWDPQQQRPRFYLQPTAESIMKYLCCDNSIWMELGLSLRHLSQFWSLLIPTKRLETARCSRPFWWHLSVQLGLLPIDFLRWQVFLRQKVNVSPCSGQSIL